MPNEVILPRVDMDMTTGKIARWFVETGTTVTKGQPLFEIETDKAAMEIEAPASGIIRDLADASSADIPVGSVVAWIFAEGEAAPSREAPRSGPAAPEASRREAEDLTFDSALPAPFAETSGAGTMQRTGGGDPGRPRATPMARRLASTRGVDLSTVAGSGPRGRIQASDVAALKRRGAEAAAPVEPHARGATASARPEPAPASTSTASLPARRGPAAAPSLNIVRLREGRGTPVLLIHGFGADANSWRPFLGGGSSVRPVMGLDLPGHGGSPLGAVASFDDLVEAVGTALDGAGLGAVDLVGHSLGGAVAAALAGRGSLDARSLLLIGPAGLGPAVNGAFLRGFLGATTEAALTPWMHELVADPAAITAPFVRATLKARAGSELVASQRKVAAAVFPDDTQAFSIRADLKRLAMPARIVVGMADKILPPGYADSLPPLIALHRLANIGHMPHLEARDLVAAVHAHMTSV